jgi:glutamate racemase
VRIGITDSGLGGLSVCAAVEADLREAHTAGRGVELVYLNAALRDDFGYNSMPSRRQKVDTFGRFLSNVAEAYAPDLLYVACNSLSVLLPDCRGSWRGVMPVQGIVATGTAALHAELKADPRAGVLVLATPTTVQEATYRRNLIGAGIAAERVVQQACPDLATAITNDHTGQRARQLLERLIPEALRQFRTPPDRLIVFLGCTHYGYQSELIGQMLRRHVGRVTLLNPNRGAADEIVQGLDMDSVGQPLRVRFATPYPIPAEAQATLPYYLGNRAPLTLAALHSAEIDQALYRGV